MKIKKYNTLYGGILTLLMGASGARIIGLVCTPIIARLYTPSDLGLLALFVAFVTIISPMVSLKYSTAIPLPRTDGMALNVFVLGLGVACITLIIAGGVLYFFKSYLFSLLNADELQDWWWLLVLALAGAAIYELLNMWGVRKRRYKALAKGDVISSLVGDVTKLLLGVVAVKPLGLLLGQLLVSATGAAILLANFIEDFAARCSAISAKRMWLVASFYRQFVYYRMPSQLLLSVSAQAPIIMMASLYTQDDTGQLSLAIMALALPANLLGSAIAKAFYAEISVIGKNHLKKIRRLAFDLQKKLFFLGGPFVILAVLLSEWVFEIVFGAQWVVAGTYAAILAPFIFFQLISAPLLQVLNVVGDQRAFLVINTVRVLGLMVIYLSVINSSIDKHEFVRVLSVYLSVFYVASGLYVFWVMNNEVRNR